MSEIKWIKLSTQIFNDEKIQLIEAMPEADTILNIWFKLIVQAGKTNAGGLIFLVENIPYTEEMLSTIFRRPLNTVRLALKVLRGLQMIELKEDGMIVLVNWEKHQNIEVLERLRENARLRQQKHRETLKTEQKEHSVTLLSQNVTPQNKKEEEEKEKEKEEESFEVGNLFIKYFNRNSSSMEKQTVKYLIQAHGIKVVTDAFHKAMLQGKFSIAYVKGIMKKEIEQQVILQRKVEAEKAKRVELEEARKERMNSHENEKKQIQKLWKLFRETDSNFFSKSEKEEITKALNEGMILRAITLLHKVEEDTAEVKTITDLSETFSAKKSLRSKIQKIRN